MSFVNKLGMVRDMFIILLLYSICPHALFIKAYPIKPNSMTYVVLNEVEHLLRIRGIYYISDM